MNKTHFSSRTGVLLRLVHGSKRFFVASILFAWMTSLLDLINPKIISFAVDAVIGEKNISAPAYLQPLLNVSGGISGLIDCVGDFADCSAGRQLPLCISGDEFQRAGENAEEHPKSVVSAYYFAPTDLAQSESYR